MKKSLIMFTIGCIGFVFVFITSNFLSSIDCTSMELREDSVFDTLEEKTERCEQYLQILLLIMASSYIIMIFFMTLAVIWIINEILYFDSTKDEGKVSKP